MHVWLIKDGETLPIQAGQRRMRMGLLAEALLARGHSVSWWSSTFSHQRKKLLFSCDTCVRVNPNLALNLIHAGSYRRNISVRRYLHHKLLARRFRMKVAREAKPAVVVCAYPQIDLAFQAVSYAQKHCIPIILDIRDLWPDTFLEHIPGLIRAVARPLLKRDFARAAYAFRNADALAAISRGCLDWALSYAGRSGSERDQVCYTGYPKIPKTEGTDRMLKMGHTLKDKVVFCFVGSFGLSYELSLLCDVAERLQSSGQKGIQFVLAGDGDQYSRIARRARSLTNVSLAGWLDQFEIQQLLAMSDVGIIPNRMVVDAMPNKLFEYLSAGLPVISSLEGEVEQRIAESQIGFSYRCGDGDTLYRHVLALANDRARRMEMSANARALFNRDFQESENYIRFARLVESLANHRTIE